MNRPARITLTLAAALLAAGAAAGATLDRAGVWAPPALVPAAGPAAADRSLVPDGSFEQGPPPASAWTETAAGGCEWIGDNSGAWYVSAFDGVNDVWLGGYCDDGAGGYGPTSTTITQDVAVPAGDPVLSFRYLALRVDQDDEPADGDRAYVTVDGVEVWSFPFVSAGNTYPDWTGPVEIDLSAWAGRTVPLAFVGIGVGEATGNARFDYVGIGDGATPAERSTWSALKASYR